MRALCVLALVSLFVLTAAAAPACPGDCDGDGSIRVDEILYGVAQALEGRGPEACPSLDRNADGSVSVFELVRAVGYALAGCPATPTSSSTPSPPPTSSPTASASPTDTPTSTPTSVPTFTPTSPPTPTVNQPPVLPPPQVYRTYPGFPIEIEIGALDPEDGAVGCTSEDLPEGADLDAGAQRLVWTPADDQLGAFYVPFSCNDEGDPPRSVEGQLTFQVSPLDSCVRPECDPAAGCEKTLPPLEDGPCCVADADERLIEPDAGCPEGAIVFVGRNLRGFGRLQNCDWMRVRNFLQAGAEVLFHVASRCLSTLNRVTVHARMETADRFLFDDSRQVFLSPRPDGLEQLLNLRFPIESEGPFFDLENAEADLTVTITDSLGVSATESVRLRLNFEAQPDLPDGSVDTPE